MKFLLLQNTLAPYRISLFNKLYELGMDIELLYMDEMERFRSWKIDYDTIKYPYTIDYKGYKGSIKGFDIYWNWKFIRRFIKEKDVSIILGGPWNFPDTIVTCALKRLGIIKAPIYFWSEANYLTIGSQKKNWIRDWIRSFVYSTSNKGIIVSGYRAIESFEKWDIKVSNFIRLPNVIEEEVFSQTSDVEHTFTSFEQKPIFVFPVRLNEAIKGVVNFFKAIGSENIKKAHFYVLGDGPDEKMTRSFIIDNGYQNSIELCGFCDMKTVVEYYRKSDVLVLPSFSDASPLALVEGCCSKMPLLVSNRCGNHYETIIDGQNGYIFNPDNADEIKTAFENILHNRAKWKEMGCISRKLFEQNFEQKNVIPSFIKEISQSKYL